MKRSFGHILAALAVIMALVCGMVLEHHHHDADGSLCIGLCLEGHDCGGHCHHHPADAPGDDGDSDCSMHIDTPLCHDLDQWYAALSAPVTAVLPETASTVSPALLQSRRVELPRQSATPARPYVAQVSRRGPPVC